MVTPQNWLSSTYRWLLALSLCGFVGAVHAQDDIESVSVSSIDIEGHQSPSSKPTLLDAWLSIEREVSVNWSRAFVVRDDLVAEERHRQRRLIAELDGLALQVRLLSAPEVADGLRSWQQALSQLDEGRIPGRVDPTWLMAHLRQIPQIQDIDRMGWCQTPNWVEAWTLHGVERLPWQPGMTTDTLLEGLKGSAYDRADTLRLISPQGEISKLGIAAWNHEQAPLIPGSRVVISLPLDSISARWVDMALPQFLATRLPGDECITADPAHLYQ